MTMWSIRNFGVPSGYYSKLMWPSVCCTFDSMIKLMYGRVTTKHVYDLAWSPDSEFLIAGSTDNTASIWKAGTGESSFNASTETKLTSRGMCVCTQRAPAQCSRRSLGSAERIHSHPEL